MKTTKVFLILFFFSNSISSEIRDIIGFHELNLNRENALQLVFKNNKNLSPEAYQLSVSKQKIEVEAATEAGYFYALQAMRQLILNKK